MNIRKIQENKQIFFNYEAMRLRASIDCYYSSIVGIGKPLYDIMITKDSGSIKRLSESECIDIIRSAFSLEKTEEVNLRSF